MAANPVRLALYGLLSGDATLTGLLSKPDAIFYARAPQDAKPPYVILNKQAGTASWTFREPMQWDTWLAKGVARSGSGGLATDKAETIADRIDELLHDAPLAIPGFDLLYLRRESDVDYPEPDGGETYRHCGHLYRVITDPT